MTLGPFDLQLAEALAEERLTLARPTRLSTGGLRPHRVRRERSSRRLGAPAPHLPIHFHRPAHSVAGH